MAERKQWIDALRAMAMIFVIYGHMYGGWREYLVFTSPIKIPLFFAITGYLFSVKGKELKPFIKKLLITLGIPYFWLTLFPIKLIGGFIPAVEDSVPEVLYRFFSGEYLWYIPCCFFAEILHFLVRKISKSPMEVTVGSVSLTAIGFLMIEYDIGSFMYLSNAFVSQGFLLIGYLIRVNEDRFNKIGWGPTAVLTVLYIALGFLSLYLFPGQCLSAHENRYYNIPMCFAMIYVGCFAMFLIFKNLKAVPKSLVFIGQNTLAYYAFNKYFRSPVIFVFGLFGFAFPINKVTGLLLTIGCCIACWPISVLLNKYFPSSVGKKPIKR